MSVPDKFDAINGRLDADTRGKYDELLAQANANAGEHWQFEIVPGFFKQSLAETDDYTFDYLKQDFGRIHSWESTFQELDALNAAAGANEAYKVFFLARHGEGYHNVGHTKYGNDEWNRKWSKLTGDGELVWGPDPELTELGVNQAKANAREWGEQIKQGARLPTKWFTSPFIRSVDTLIDTWKDHVDLKKVQPLIKEDLRETLGVHLCDKRSPRSAIAARYEPQGIVIEEGFAEEDIYFKDDYRETIEEHAIRLNRAFQYIFSNYSDPVVSITSHSGSIRAQLLVLNHREFTIGTGGMVPVFVKATKHTS